MTVLPLVSARSIHARGYNNFNDMDSTVFHEVNMALFSCRNTPNFIEVLRKWEKDLMPEQIMFSFMYINEHKLEKNPDYWNFLVPMVKKQMTTLDRNTIKSMYNAIYGAAVGHLQDNEFWEIVEQKLVDEGLHRYLDLDQLGNIIVALGQVGRGSDDLVEIIEKTFIKHRKGLTPKIIN